VAFLPKPIDEEQISRTLELLVNKISNSKDQGTISETSNAFTNKSVFVKTEQALVKIQLADIQIIEVQNRDCIIYTGKTSYTIRRTLAEVESKLPNGLLTKVHRSYLVNLNYLDSFDTISNRIIIGDRYIPVSKTHKEEVISSLELF